MLASRCHNLVIWFYFIDLLRERARTGFLRKLNITVDSILFDKISTLNSAISKMFHNI